MIVLDFETASKVNLKTCGTTPYARHESTHLLCLSYLGFPHFDIKALHLWIPGDEDPEFLFEAIEKGEEFHAHNVFFERNIWHEICHKRMGWPDVPEHQWRCTMAKCCRMGLPRSLDQAGAALRLAFRKDKSAKATLMRLCKPKKPSKECPSIWDRDPAKLKIVYDYNLQDVLAEFEVDQPLPDLDGKELEIWQLDQRINARGLLIDRQAVENALAIVAQMNKDFLVDINLLTDGEVSSPTEVAGIKRWMTGKLGGEPKSLDAAAVKAFVENPEVPEEVKEVLRIRQAASKTSTAKLEAMIQRCDEDNRVRGNTVYHGASTGRWSGAGMQIHNFPRGKLGFDDIERIHTLLGLVDPMAINLVYGDPMDALSSSLRSFIIAPEGSQLYVCDFASIEARVLAWVAGEEDLLQAFRDGADPYKLMASKIFEKPQDEIDKSERFLGKSAVLGCGYSMGYRKFRDSCWTVGKTRVPLKLSKHVVKMYRDANPSIVGLWKSMYDGMLSALQEGETVEVGNISIAMGKKTLQVYLPSGRELNYWYPTVEHIEAPWSKMFKGNIYASAEQEEWLEDVGCDLGEYDGACFTKSKITSAVGKFLVKRGFRLEMEKPKLQLIPQICYMAVDSQTKKWTKHRTYGGHAVENLIQAIARDFLAEAMLRVEHAGYSIVATVHDEIIAEVPDWFGDLHDYEQLMTEVPHWGKGCPIGVEGYVSKRYRK